MSKAIKDGEVRGEKKPPTQRQQLLDAKQDIELAKARKAASKVSSQDLELMGRYGQILAEERAELDSRKNWDFTQVTNDEWRPIRSLMLNHPKACALLTILVEKMNTQNAILATQDVLCKLTGMSRATLNRNIKILRDDNWIKTMRVGGSTAFFINSAVFWKADRGGRLAAFHATVLTSEEEQKMTFEQWDSVKIRSFPVMSQDRKQRLLLSGSEEGIPPPDQLEMGLN